jgi:hypothetical protein
MPKPRPKQTVQPKEKAKETTAESLKAQKKEAVKKFKKFDDYAKKYGSIQSMQETFIKEDLDIKSLAKKPKYKEIFSKLISLTHEGIGSLHLLKGVRIEKGLNLVKLKDKLGKLKQNLKSTLDQWRKTNSKLERAIDVERKRVELFTKLYNNSDKFIDETPGTSAKDMDRMQDMINKHPEYKKLQQKITNASVDELNEMRREENIFDKISEYSKKLAEAEPKRKELIADFDSAPFTVAYNNPHLKTNEQIKAAEHAIKQSDFYKKFRHKLYTMDPESILGFHKQQNLHETYEPEFELSAYQYANEDRLDNALKPYLKLKPKNISEDKFLAALRNSTYYNKVFDAIQKGNLEQQKSFEPTAYMNFDAEMGVHIAMANGAGADNLYSYAKMLAERMQQKVPKGKIVPEDTGFA